MEEAPKVVKMTDFSCIPSKVIRNCIIPHLQWNDLLRLRRVCTWTKAIVHGFIRLHPEMTPELEINLDDKTFGDFLKMGIPTTRIFFSNVSGEEFYKTAGKSGEIFLRKCGPSVKHLRVAEFSPTFKRHEVAFLKAFINLESFEANMFGYNALRDKDVSNKVVFERGRKDLWNFENVESSFEYLKKIKLGNGNNDVFIFRNMMECFADILQRCVCLEDITLPFHEYFDIPPGPSHALYWVFQMVPTVFKEAGIIGPGSCLRTVDFTNFHSIEEGKYLPILEKALPEFPKLLESFMKHSATLFNVGADWFYDMAVARPSLGTSVYSLVNLHPNVLKMEMPNLEKIDIRSSRQSSPGGLAENLDMMQPDWPALKILEIRMNSGVCGYYKFKTKKKNISIRKGEESSARIILDFFFKTVIRPALADLRLHFTDEDPSIVPEAEDIIKSCPNLRKLELVGWPGTNTELAKLWCGLPDLEEVSFEDCYDLGNAAFVGEDVGNPAFLNLTKLKRLSLKGLDKMPKVTDKLFSLVVRHMPLTHLTLTSSVPLKSVTLTGIRSLLDGKFAETVEKFSFQDWSLANVSARKLSELRSKFRSSSML